MESESLPVGDEVTALVARWVEPGCEDQFEAWAEGILKEAAGFPGHLGSGLLRPAGTGQPWHVVYRFADDASYLTWQNSPARAGWFASIDGHHAETERRELKGLEPWFAGRASAPPRWKMAAASALGIYPIALVGNAWVAPVLQAWPLAGRTFAIALLFSTLMTFVAMPAITWVLRCWLFGAGSSAPAPPSRTRREE